MFKEARTRHAPNPDLDRVRRDVDLLFEQIVSRSIWVGHVRPRTWSPPTDVFETEDYFLVRVEISGMREDDFELSFVDGVLFVTGTRAEPEAPPRAYHQMEIRYGPFATALRINHPIDLDHIEAHYDAGFLTVILPKQRRAERRLEIR